MMDASWLVIGEVDPEMERELDERRYMRMMPKLVYEAWPRQGASALGPLLVQRGTRLGRSTTDHPWPCYPMWLHVLWMWGVSSRLPAGWWDSVAMDARTPAHASDFARLLDEHGSLVEIAAQAALRDHPAPRGYVDPEAGSSIAQLVDLQLGRQSPMEDPALWSVNVRR